MDYKITEQGIEAALEEISHGRADEPHDKFIARGKRIIASHCKVEIAKEVELARKLPTNPVFHIAPRLFP